MKHNFKLLLSTTNRSPLRGFYWFDIIFFSTNSTPLRGSIKSLIQLSLKYCKLISYVLFNIRYRIRKLKSFMTFYVFYGSKNHQLQSPYIVRSNTQLSESKVFYEPNF